MKIKGLGREKTHLPKFTKHRKNKCQFKIKKQNKQIERNL